MSQTIFEAEIEVAVKQLIWVPMKVRFKAKNEEDAYEKVSGIKEPADLAVFLDENEIEMEEAQSIDEILVDLSAEPVRSAIESREWEMVEYSEDTLQEAEDE